MKRFKQQMPVAALAALSFVAAPAFADGPLKDQTKQNLEAAMHGEAYAHLKYLAYAEHARKSGHPEIAKLFDESANVEANEHFAREAEALNLAKSDEANLADGMAGEHYENTKMYVKFAEQADTAGDKKVAAMFRQIAADEGDHYAAFRAASEKLRTASK
ncbi:rubrerythrin family protein [Burkholderia vietnamiensis]|uniref:Rubrerythrin family protein n=1 Tax=Burkholderia vietnamiensis TaxID=60552 RepID=A0AAW7TAQ9_BURVI|nr:rubrerythrin family protein [Burkholderia vietnamiensis]MDN7798699.1 rubrerythrin family protein [Burkholderia vietnamiensis]HDR9190002.1 rubrerythrin family protein [Burkholderia vietnamiensis]